jgi:hypothetical protein
MGKLVEKEWATFAALVVSKHADEGQTAEMKLAFFSGGLAVFALLMTVLDPGAGPTEADLDRVGAINEELESFSRDKLKSMALRRHLESPPQREPEVKPQEGRGFSVNGIVAQRDKLPYIQLSNEKGIIAQLSMAQTHQIARDMLVMAARTEADAMLLKFFAHERYPDEAGAAMMMEFREFRAGLDDENVKHSHREGM